MSEAGASLAAGNEDLCRALESIADYAANVLATAARTDHRHPPRHNASSHASGGAAGALKPVKEFGNAQYYNCRAV